MKRMGFKTYPPNKSSDKEIDSYFIRGEYIIPAIREGHLKEFLNRALVRRSPLVIESGDDKGAVQFLIYKSGHLYMEALLGDEEHDNGRIEKLTSLGFREDLELKQFGIYSRMFSFSSETKDELFKNISKLIILILTRVYNVSRAAEYIINLVEDDSVEQAPTEQLMELLNNDEINFNI